MSTRRSLYYAWCLLSSSKSVVEKSVPMAGKAFKQWFDASPLVGSALNNCQMYRDKDWDAAKVLSEQIRHSGSIGTRKPFSGKRQYSTTARDKDKTEELKSSEVPTSRISRLFHYGSLAAGVGLNVAKQSISEVAKGKSPQWKSMILSDANIDRITAKFSQMRGAALKIGQMMSFQDEKLLPRELYEILSRVQNSANYMPKRQLERVMTRELGPAWKSKFINFDEIPFAAASIGQVHKATLISGEEVVCKVQYPGVRDSIDSDLNNLLMLLTASKLLPKGLFLDKTVANARKELKWECDYIREAQALQKFGDLLQGDPVFDVPTVFKELSTENVLTMQRMPGTEIMKLPDATTNQETRDFISENIMRLCLEEIATFEYMQTDPNWANFLYNDRGPTPRIELLDFGASRPFPDGFITKYRKLLTYATLGDRHNVQIMSKELGYLNGLESQAMIDAHVDSVMTLGEPFSGDVNKAFDFRDQTVSDRIRGNIGLMLNERLCPPPEETYSLHRKFSGIFLLCARMGARVHCAKLFQEVFALHE
ncbi:similar to Saccharomyces cerevisiae YGL119W COQ8 Protein required for ubiquinone (coenzyme Q) biosynthesis and for respiratory growth [Maudiozyma saulgeensis]|uniref:Similar to Saccharomyces cerevisiae YGL119W COQ8 Protein required for ubiquinone (Coenzyme Q) biosynthesis and for respiratory growth n=1 Tax=Maudiozyma saulgeensis TaxID=1789683 RepID=A0A1X7RBN1_9SACH|nr:similar to Saccharomyces cerevisiae YGL119W COQ8 Protein required for ubiquinone (coenzyme Q) biosynthesis and for respiratory growth [Kazachstania saulgeensis]